MNHSFTSIEGLKNVFFNKAAQKLTTRILFTGLLFCCLIYNSFAAPIVVSSCTQYGAGSIDAAITAANGNSNLDTIVFTCNSINLTNKLLITNPVIIDGYTSAAPACGPGTRTELVYNGGGIAIHINNTSNVTIRGLVISGTGIAVGIEIDGSTNCKVEGNYIGITANGLALANPGIQNNSQAIWLQGGSGHTIGGATCRERNVVSNYNMCVEIKGSTNNTVINNYLGTDYLGKSPLIDATYNPAPYTVEYNSFGVHVIEGCTDTKVLNNVIGSRRKYGIFFDKTNNNSNPGNNPVIRGNLVGIGTDSLTKMGNGWAGIFLHRSQNAAIGGPNAADRNYSGNNGYLPQGIWETTGSGHGIQLTELAGASNIENNVTGLSPDGKTPMPNAQDGISLLGSSNNTIKNNISQWNTYGIFLQGLTDYGQATLPIKDPCSNNKIIGNIVKYNGYNPQNPTEGGGIALQFSSSNNWIGKDSIGLGNVADSNLTGITLRNDRINSGLANIIPYGAFNNRIYNNTVINSTSVTDVSKIKYKDMPGVGIVVHGNGSDNNFIGGSQPLQANTITLNASNGVYIETGIKNWVFPQNKITCNGGAAGAQGIRLAAKPASTGVIGNDNYGSTSPVAGHVTVNAPNTGSADASDSTGANYAYKGYAPANSIVYVYLADACYSCSTTGSNGLFKQGETLIDTVFADASGIWTYSLAKPVGNGIVVYASEPGGANRNTSELSQCYFPACFPPATAVISPANPATVCKGTTVTLTANLENTYIYTWYKGATIVAGPSTTHTFSATATGSYTVRIADPSNPDNPLCYRTSDPVSVTVDSSTVPGTVGANQSICNGVVPDPFTSIQAATGGNGTYSYQWQSSTDNVTFNNIANDTLSTYASPALSSTTYFRRSVTAGTCSATYSDTIKVTVDSLSKGGSISGEKTVCSGVNNGTLTLNGHVGVVQKWERSTDNFNTVTQINITGNTHSFTDLTTTTRFRAIVKSGACSSDTSLIAIITVDSVSDGGSVIGGTSVCSTTNSGNLTLTGKVGSIVRWESSTDNFATVSNLANANNSSYTYTNLAVTTQFRVIVQSGICSQSTSLPATITVDSVSQGGSITGGGAICGTINNGTLNLTGKAGNVIRWESSTDNFTTVVDSINNSLTTYSYTNLLVTTQFRAIVQSGGCAESISTPATITVDSVSKGGSLDGGGPVCGTVNGGVLKLTGKIGDVVRWESSTDNFTTVVNSINNNLSTYSYTNIPVTTQFRVIVKSGSCPSSTSTVAAVTVDSVSQGGSITGGGAICGTINNGTLNLTGKVGNVIRWESSTDSFGTIENISNTSPTYAYTNLLVTTQFRAIVQSGGCAESTSSPATLTVDSVSKGGSLDGGGPVCGTVNGGVLKLTGKIGDVVRWESSTDNFTAVVNSINNNLSTYSYTNIPVTTQFRVIVKSGSCPSSTSTVAAVTVDPVSQGGSITGGSTQCAAGNNGTLNLINSVGDVINWESSTDNFTNVTNIPNTTTSQTYNNLPATTQFRAIVQSGSCSSATSTQATITVDAASVGGSATASIIEACGNLPSTSISLSGEAGSIIQWQTSADNTNWADIPGATASPYTATNLTATTYFRAQVKSGVCDSATSGVATITISNGSKGGTATAALSPVCQHNSTTVSITGYNGNSIQWQQSPNGNSNWTNVTTGTNATTATYTTPNLTATTYYRAIVKNGSCDTSGSSIDMVSVLAVPPFKLGADTLICEGTDMKLMAPSGFQKYAWNNGSTNQVILIAASGFYWVKAETSTGCPVADSIKINECNKLTIPNVYTPNGDPLNQTFIIQGNRPNSNLVVYNRWGSEVYSSKNYNNTWDGQGCTDGVYYYIYKRPIDQKSLHGWVEIIRD